MDYLFASAVSFFAMPLLLISYDICCQWFINLHKRMASFWPDALKIPSTTKLTPAIPKLHEPMHGKANHQHFSLNFIPGVGQSDFECPERFWSLHNSLGNATKTQGPGSRQDVLDDHFAAYNWMKYISIGSYLLRRYKAAVADRNIQTEAHRGLTNSVGQDLADKWESVCVEWEKDTAIPKTKINPYETEGVGKCFNH